MDKLFILFKREYLSIVKRKSFVVTTFVIPLFLFLSFFIPEKLAKLSTGEAKTVGIYDQLGITDSLTTGQMFAFYHLDSSEFILMKDKFDYLIWVPLNLDQDSILIIINSPGEFQSRYMINSILRQAVIHHFATNAGLSAQQINSIFYYSPIKTEYSESLKIQSEQNIILPIIMVFLLHMSVFIYGFNISRSLIEEKKNKVMEFMISHTSPVKIITAKVFGSGLAGISQVLIWLSAIFILTKVNHQVFNFSLSYEILMYFIIYYLIGFTLFSQVNTFAGALFEDEKDAQQFYALMGGISSLPIFSFIYIVSHPETFLAKILSYIPLFTPIAMFTRLVVSHPPVYDFILTILISIVTIIIIQMVLGKVFTVKILLYGKKPSLRSFIKILKK
ncbi:MAG: ABC transporter permease [bacterium]